MTEVYEDPTSPADTPERDRHYFTHNAHGDIYCTCCGYVAYVVDSNYERNNLRQRLIPAKCGGAQ